MASLTGELKPGCLVQINMRTRKPPNGRSVRETSFAIFLERLPGRSYKGRTRSPILRFLMPSGTIKEIWEDIFETTAHMWVKVIEKEEDDQ
jgi:hypothetical protein